MAKSDLGFYSRNDSTRETIPFQGPQNHKKGTGSPQLNPRKPKAETSAKSVGSEERPTHLPPFCDGCPPGPPPLPWAILHTPPIPAPSGGLSKVLCPPIGNGCSYLEAVPPSTIQAREGCGVTKAYKEARQRERSWICEQRQESRGRGAGALSGQGFLASTLPLQPLFQEVQLKGDKPPPCLRGNQQREVETKDPKGPFTGPNMLPLLPFRGQLNH